MTFGQGEENLDAALLHQIRIDVQRTNAGIPLYQNEITQDVRFDFKFVDLKENSLLLGYKTSSFWLCAGYK
jgi:hypothetical protein